MPRRPPVFRTALQEDISRRAAAAYEARRLAETETRKLYKTGRWYALRARQLRDHPLCAMCEAEGMITAAIICDHVHPHRGDVVKFWSGPFQSLCKAHHDGAKQREERLYPFGGKGS